MRRDEKSQAEMIENDLIFANKNQDEFIMIYSVEFFLFFFEDFVALKTGIDHSAIRFRHFQDQYKIQKKLRKPQIISHKCFRSSVRH